MLKLISSISILILILHILEISCGVSKFVKDPCFVKKERTSVKYINENRIIFKRYWKLNTLLFA